MAPPATVAVRELTTVPELERAADLFTATWPGQPPAGTNLLRAIGHAGGYVGGAYTADGVLVGAAMGFLAEHGGPALHSHLAAVTPASRGTGVGVALKRHQHAWAREHGLVAVTWTFDPLVRRNAWLNITKLGAAVEAYLPDFYGRMDDGINDGDETDRLLAVWATAASPSEDPDTHEAVPLLEEVAGAPVRGSPGADAAVLAVATPPDVETLRRTDPALALQWRRAVRDALVPVLADGGRIVGFSRGGSYLVRR